LGGANINFDARLYPAPIHQIPHFKALPCFGIRANGTHSTELCDMKQAESPAVIFNVTDADVLESIKIRVYWQVVFLIRYTAWNR
jgi:hypothetical protein